MNRPMLSYFLIGIAVPGIFAWTTRNANAQLYAVDWDSGNLYTVSISNAALTLVGNTGFGAGGFTGSGLAEIQFSPNGTLYGFSTGTTPTLYTIDPSTAKPTPVGPLGLAFVAEGGLAIAPNGT